MSKDEIVVRKSELPAPAHEAGLTAWNGKRIRNEPEQIAVQLAVMFAAFGAEVSEQRQEIYIEHLLDIPPDRLEKAIKRCIAECKFLPVIADIREKYEEDRQAPAARSHLTEEEIRARPWNPNVQIYQESQAERMERLRKTAKWGHRYGDRED